VKLARVVATVVATRKDPKLEGLRLFLLQDLDRALKPKDSIVVAADSVGCGVGELVLYASGSSARQTIQTDGRPCDATVMAIIDAIDDGEGERIYEKFRDA
jgi:microcompartment protein CcmK/EutM